jgi:beta-phosphoglucomutase-like phosphatase (HAD superfamily)
MKGYEIRAIILDFDGTLVESVGIKDDAFRALFSEYPEHLPAIMEYHLTQNATVRFEKFRHITESILGMQYDDHTKERLSRTFSEMVFRRITECPFVAGAEEFLEHFCRKIPLYLSSASPDEELSRILETRCLRDFFRHVYAASWPKEDAIRNILKKEDIPPENAVFIGDAFEDYEAARSAGVQFIGRNSRKSFRNAPVAVYKDLFEIKEVLSQDIRRHHQ